MARPLPLASCFVAPGSPVDNRAPVKSPTGHMVQLKRTESVAREKAAAPAVSDAPAQMVQLRKTEKQVHAPAGEVSDAGLGTWEVTGWGAWRSCGEIASSVWGNGVWDSGFRV